MELIPVCLREKTNSLRPCPAHPLIRPSDTLSPSGGEGRGEGDSSLFESEPEQKASLNSSDVQVANIQGVVLDELLARLHFIAHELGEHLFGLDGVGQVDFEQFALGRIQ